MSTTTDPSGGGKGSTKKKLPKSISRSNMQKSEALKRKLQDSLLQYRMQGFPHTLGNMTRYDVRLPNLRDKSPEFQEFVENLLIDHAMLQDLEDAQVINFCRTAQKLYPLKTAGDGNCLLHAVSMAIWGIHDKAMLLRRLVYISLVEDCNTQGFCRRWEKERRRIQESVPEGMHLSTGQWTSEWDLVVKAAEDLKRTAASAGDLPFESLEEIHIFVLANVIQRPIIVLSDSVIRSLRGSILAPNNFSGIYLPLLWDPQRCRKSPIVLGYYAGHFTPLVHMEAEDNATIAPSRQAIIGEYVVPLVTQNIEPLHIHFLSGDEDTDANQILQKYLKVLEMNWTRADGFHLLLSAKLEHNKIDCEYDLMTDYIQELERRHHSTRLSGGKTNDSHESHVTHQRKEVNKEHIHTQKKEEMPGPKLSLSGPNSSHASRSDPNKSSTPKVRDKVPQVKPQHLDKVIFTTKQQTKHLNITNPNSNLQISGETARKCLKRGCKYYGALEYGGFCHGCFLESTKHYQEGFIEPTPEPMEYIPSVSSEKCAQRYCSNMASIHTFPYCHEHNQVRPTSHHVVQVRPVYEPSITDYKCSHRGCKNIASIKTFPFCHEHKTVTAGTPSPRYAVTHNEMRVQQITPGLPPLSITHYQCIESGCIHAASNSTYPYCHVHAPSASNDQPEIPMLYMSTRLDTRPAAHGVQHEEYEPSLTTYKCKFSRCRNIASFTTFPYCHEHHTQHMPTAEPKRASLHDNHFSLERISDANNHDECDKKCCSLDSYHPGPSQPCKEPNCKLFAPPAFGYYCPQHYALRQIPANNDLVDHRNTSSHQDCVNPGCTKEANTKYEGLCASCYVQQGLNQGSSVLCKQSSCNNKANSKYSGLCSSCFLQQDFIEHLESERTEEQLFDSIPQESSQTRRNIDETSATWSAAPVSPGIPIGKTSVNDEPSLSYLSGSLQRLQSQEMCNQTEDILLQSPDPADPIAPCLGPECSNPGSPTLKGLCRDCYGFLSQKRKDRSSRGTRDSALSDDGACLAVSDDGALPSELPCVKEGCPMYGRAENQFFCGHCYQEFLKQGGLHTQAVYGTGTSPFHVSSLQLPSYSGSKSRVIPCCTHRSESPVLEIRYSNPKAYIPGGSMMVMAPNGVNPAGEYCMNCRTSTASDRKPQPSTGFMALQKLENTVRASRRKCKTNLCRNFGNPSKQGYCNSCHIPRL